MQMIEERKSLIKSMKAKCSQNSGENSDFDVEKYQLLSGKRLDFLDILLLTRVGFFS